MTRGGRKGFTLVEVLVAMAIFGILSALAYQAMGQSLSNADLLNDRMDRLRAIQQTMRLLGSDIRQTAPRPIRDSLNGAMIPAIRTAAGSEFALEVTRGGWPNPVGLPRGTLQRVQYRIEDGELVRYHWVVLDPALSSDALATVLLDDVESIVVNYLAPGGDWSNQWPPVGAAGQQALYMRPHVVEVVISLTDQGEIRRFFEVAP